MQYLLQGATVIDPGSPYHLQKTDLLIGEGILQDVGRSLNVSNSGATVLNGEGTYVSQGWIDVGAQHGDPGHEYREDLHSLIQLAAEGGFTGLAPLPTTDPCIQTKADIQYLLKTVEHSPVQVYPLGVVTVKTKGMDLAELYDLHTAGAFGFTDGMSSIQHSGVLLKALQYVKAFNGLVMQHSLDAPLAFGGSVHEGHVSVSLGLKGIPDLAESLMVKRDLELAQYANARLLLLQISAAASVNLIRESKIAGHKVHATVPVMNLIHTEEALLDFDTNFKVFPPLRAAKDLEALRQGLADGTIDLVSSNHTPLDEEVKLVEFPYALPGASTLGLVYPLLNTYLNLSPEEIAALLADRPRAVLGIPPSTIVPGNKANLTWFHPNGSFTHAPGLRSGKSSNDPYKGLALKGTVLGVFNKGMTQLFNV